ncbi:MAG: cytochrome P450 [Legionellaceae bacterium]|nr:cytochrome P450 [Legionellaceae bacterium]
MTNTALPPGPSKKNFFQFMKIIANPLPILEECKRIYGKTFTLRLSGQPDNVVISDPIDLKQIFSATHTQLNTGEMNATLLQPVLGDYSLLTLDGKRHLQHRKLLLPPFHGQRMKDYGELMSKIAKRRILNWKQNNTLKLLDEVREITFDIILKAIFGMDEESSRFKKLTQLLHQLNHVISKTFSVITLITPFLHKNLGFLTPWANIMKLRREVDLCLFDEISARKKMSLDSRIDILSLLLQARDENGDAMTDQEIRDEMLTLLLAGHETSTTGIAWSFYGILSNPHVLKKLKDELNQFVSDDTELVSNLDKLVYLDATIKEALRITPVFPNLLRITNEPYQLRDHTFPKGTVIVPCMYLAHHDPENWTEPHKFMPERFLNSTENPYTYLPFGSGIRRCIGAAFAQYEMKIIIAQILMNLELKLKDNYVAKPERKGPVIVPSDGVPIVIQKIIS